MSDIYMNDNSSSESDDETFNLETNELQPYAFEPLLDTEKQPTITENEMDRESQRRIGNTAWCNCGSCKAMESEEESKCCKDSDETPEHYFGGKVCITQNENFKLVCLSKEVLRTALHALNNLRGDSIVISNRSFRYAEYRQYTWWVHNRLGRGFKKLIPSCAAWAIRDAYPESDYKYLPFQEARDEINN